MLLHSVAFITGQFHFTTDKKHARQQLAKTHQRVRRGTKTLLCGNALRCTSSVGQLLLSCEPDTTCTIQPFWTGQLRQFTQANWLERCEDSNVQAHLGSAS